MPLIPSMKHLKSFFHIQSKMGQVVKYSAIYEKRISDFSWHLLQVTEALTVFHSSNRGIIDLMNQYGICLAAQNNKTW